MSWETAPKSPTTQPVSGRFRRLGAPTEVSVMRSTFFLRRLFSRDAYSGPRARDRAKISQIGFIGLFGIGNFGNEGSLEAMLRFVRKVRTGAEVVCICGSPTKVDPKLGIRSVGINWRPKNQLLRRLDRLLMYIPGELASLVHTVHHIRRLDVLVIPGTGILDDYGAGPMGIPYWLFRWCVLARLLGTKVAFVSIGAGPIHHPLSRWLMKTASGMAAYRSFRDNISRDFMCRSGLNTGNDPVYPDIAFTLPQPVPLREPSAEGEPITVGIGIMYYNGWRGDRACDEAVYDAYIRKMKRFVCWLLSEGHRVRVLMGDVNDQRAVDTLSSMIETKRGKTCRGSVVAEPAHSLHDVMAQIADTDVVVATRFHNIVCALKLGRPTLSIGYAEKNDVLLEEMGLGEFCQNIDQLDVELLIEQFRRLAIGRKKYERKIRATNAIYAERLRHQYTLLLGSYF